MPCDTLATWAYKIKAYNLLNLVAKEQENKIVSMEQLHGFKADSTAKVYNKALKKEVRKKKFNLAMVCTVAVFAILK